MTNEIELTIVTPSYNYAQYIRECLESVQLQEGVVYEHLVYDAGSTDSSIEIIKEFEHVKLIVESDKGMSDAINKGFKVAKGKWVMWLNTDDRLKPDALRAFIDHANQNADADVIYGGWDYIDGSGDFIRTMSVFPIQKMMLSHYGCYIGSTSCFFKKSSVIDAGFLLNAKFRYVMDGEFYARLAAAGKSFVYLPQRLADFRLHGDNLSFKNNKQHDVDSLLEREYQDSESRAIRRMYGVTLSKNRHFNSVMDVILFYGFVFWKQWLKLRHKIR